MFVHSEKNSVPKVKLPFQQLYKAVLCHTWFGRLLSEIPAGNRPDFSYFFVFKSALDESSRSMTVLFMTECSAGPTLLLSCRDWDQALVETGLEKALRGSVAEVIQSKTALWSNPKKEKL